MIKEKHEKGPDNVKEEPGSSDKDVTNTDIRIKKEDEPAPSNCSSNKKEQINRPVTKNGGIIGSTNTGSLQTSVSDRKLISTTTTTTTTITPTTITSTTIIATTTSTTTTTSTKTTPATITTDTHINDQQQNIASDTNTNNLKTEDCIDNDLTNDAFSLGLSGAHQNPPDGVQPLASNVINKQTNSMEVQYMQQQSQIFVFSTGMANTGADEVLQGRYPSIIAYHCAQPGTRKYLEKNPLKITQFNRQNPAQWLNNLAMIKSKGCTRSPILGQKNQPPIDSFLGSESLDDMVLPDPDLPWDQKNNHLDGLESVNNGLPDVGPDMDACSPSLSNVQPSLQGVKVPDENLTPQQRQHREEQLATIRKMQQMLFPENQTIDNQGGPPSAIDLPHNIMTGNQQTNTTCAVTTSGTNVPPPPPNLPPSSQQQQSSHQQQQQQPPPPPPSQQQPSQPQQQQQSQQQSQPQQQNQQPSQHQQQPPQQQQQPPQQQQSQQPPPQQSPVSNQLEWLKLQHHFADDRKMKTLDSVRPPPVPIGPVSSGTPGNISGPRVPMPGSGPRLQGPPPPYHQTPRSASVPIALQSPNPASPNNPTSNLSLPSPRASSALNSPADPNRQFGLGRHVSTSQSPTSQDSPSAQRLNHSNPGTPVSSHLSPSVNNSTSEPSSTHQSSVDGMFGRTLQSMAQQKQQQQMNTSTCSTTPSAGGKEPNLMPVPSPQQIQYLNTFEGQELIIQKQPNTSLKERNIMSPPILPTTMDSGFSGSTPDLSHNRMSGPNTPTPIDISNRFPPTPGVSSESCRFQIPSPHTPTATSTGDKSQRLTGSTTAPGMSPQTAPGPTSDPLKNDLFPTPSPHMMDVPRFPGPNSSPGAKMGGGFVNVSPSGKPSTLELPNYGCTRGDNVPLNPNCTNTMSGNPKSSHFDPISSLAQMSQQLTNSVASSLNGQGNQGPNMMNFGSPSMHMMDMGGCHSMGDMDQGSGPMMGGMMQGPPHGFHPNSPMGPIRSLSPKLPGAFPNHMPMPRMMGRPPGPNPYNGANVQVKPNAPNTIQYLPAKSQVGNAPGPRGPPSLDFLQRFANPLSNMDSKMPTQNLQYFPNCTPNNGPMQGPGGPMPPHMGHMENPMQPEGPMGQMMGGPLGNGGGPPMMGGNMGMPSGMLPMMRGPMRPPMMRMPQMGFNGPQPSGPEMFNPGPNMGNTQMFVNGPKGSPMGMGAPDASQPLPPSMGQNNSFKNSPFVGPTTADPTYAQQYHNFQQQLYATSTRSQMGGQAMGPGPGPPHTQQAPYFNPK